MISMKFFPIAEVKKEDKRITLFAKLLNSDEIMRDKFSLHSQYGQHSYFERCGYVYLKEEDKSILSTGWNFFYVYGRVKIKERLHLNEKGEEIDRYFFVIPIEESTVEEI